MRGKRRTWIRIRMKTRLRTGVVGLFGKPVDLEV